jgi:hypothetical protein
VRWVDQYFTGLFLAAIEIPYGQLDQSWHTVNRSVPSACSRISSGKQTHISNSIHKKGNAYNFFPVRWQGTERTQSFLNRQFDVSHHKEGIFKLEIATCSE